MQIIKEKWKLWQKPREVAPDWEIEQEARLDLISEKLEREEQVLNVLRKSRGWKLVEEKMDAQLEVWRTKLEKGDNPDIRANVKAYRWLKNIVLSQPNEII